MSIYTDKRDSRSVAIASASENLNGTGILLTSLFCRHGSNVYVLTYERNGVKKHTFIDAGDVQYQDKMLPALAENSIEPANIEQIIITHGHPDHYGLAPLLTRESKARVITHASFQDFVEGKAGRGDRRWTGNRDPSLLRVCNMDYLHDTGKTVNIYGIDFIRLAEPIRLGNGGRLDIVGCPKSKITHSRDQIVVLYTAYSTPPPHEQANGHFRPTDDIIFSGDLWLMRGPMFYHSATDLHWYWIIGSRIVKSLFSSEGLYRRDPRNQDPRAKDALKKGFCLIRVKPGHGPEFLGTRILPLGLLAKRDILVEFGYPPGADKSLLKSAELALKVPARLDRAYAAFVKELAHWKEIGYTPDEMAGLLCRIHAEQSGGGPLVREDRQERREVLKSMLARAEGDESQPEWMHQMAVAARSKL